ncbi:helix-turn-helix domain-containing protein [Dyadobacter sp. CY343]|uniref:helix-turn-helix domain-containing protein n=1 Tax=Dyadobacter sp. CY343 TaxID=2907299 RepID=UPI001F39E005|nr:helix-turn-helix domain-containing protein [Dyadobacter sp. CY343]MCE7060655.1 helix-turn-helix domain-containing protein [Dyadobacter sp. CY343]
MSQTNISDQIRSLRKSKGLSQEALAANAGINLRTLQRIEKGSVEPRGETLRMLAQALDVSIEELATTTVSATVPVKEDSGYLKLMNLSALTLWFIPLGNVFIPLAMWIYKKNQIQGVRELGKRILNFQIAWTLITYGLAYLSIFSTFTGTFTMNPFAMLPVMLTLFVANTIFVIFMHRKISREEKNIYGNETANHQVSA